MPSERRTRVGSSRIGKGLFAARAYRTGHTIVKITGRRVSADDVWDIGGRFADNCFRFGPETFLDPLDGPGRYLNHSCAPNAAVVKRNHQLFLVAAAPIARGREILIDYSTILGADDIWTMRCRCGARACRGRVRNIATLPAKLREGYVARGMVPEFILRLPSP
ncbi:MAG TPA: SET domain-containing protein-lysine N-methyltransferase [Gemmatimonadaceae bacterium]|nr:SET domain-containing protein-lysine N-methyltransferase [Gemmatimonadaceae bacterium]